MPIDLSIRQPSDELLVLPLDDGQCIFVLGANGTGKSSLMHSLYTTHNTNSRRIVAHRQTWFSSNSLSLSPEARRNTEAAIQNSDRQTHARWRDEYSEQRANIAIFDLVDAENVRARGIACAVDAEDINLARELSKKDAPIKIINEVLKLSNIPIEISVRQNEQVVASKSGGPPYSVAELSDGERNALLISANVLTVPAGTLLLVDEPERHLHRSIISPLLTLLFQKRADCKFVVSTHDVLLPLDNPNARTVLVRSCAYSGHAVTSWEVDVIPANAPIEEGVRKDILGSRRKVVFVEGDERNSLDKPLYSLIFPGVSVIAKGGCREVETAVAGIRGAPDLHWLHAFGIVDNDRRTPADVTALQAAGVYALTVYMVESVYYHPEMQRRVAERHAAVTGEDVMARVDVAKAAALDAVRSHAQRLSARAVEKKIHDQINAMHPTQAQIAVGTPVNISVDVATELASEQAVFQALIAAKNLEGIICRYPVRETPALALIATRLGFQDRNQYENAVRKLVMDDETALTFVRELFGALHADFAT